MANKNLSVWTSIPFWRRSAAWVTGFASMLLIWLTFDTLGQISMGTDADLKEGMKTGVHKRVPAPTVINHKITYEMSTKRGHEVPVIGEKENFFGKNDYSEEEARALLHLGKLTSQTKNCMNCHTLLGNGAYYAPDLTKAWLDPAWDTTGAMVSMISTVLPSKLMERIEAGKAVSDEDNQLIKDLKINIANGTMLTKEEAMAIFLRFPSSYPTHARMMPELGITADEAKGLVAFLKHMSSIDTNGFPRNFGIEEGSTNAH